jgi:hypothetical protein
MQPVAPFSTLFTLRESTAAMSAFCVWHARCTSASMGLVASASLPADDNICLAAGRGQRLKQMPG